MSDDDEDEIPITLNYHGRQKKIDYNFDFNELLNEAFERFEIDRDKYNLSFYYYDEEQEKKVINKEINGTTFIEIYEKSNKNLMIYVKEELIEERKKEKKIELNNNNNLNSNISLDYDDPLKNSESSSFYREINERANQQKFDSKTEENKEVNNNLIPKASFDNIDDSVNRSEIYMNNSFKKKNLEIFNKLKEIRNKHNEISRRKSELDSKSNELKKNIEEINKLIEKSKVEKQLDEKNNNDKELLIKLENEKSKLENIEKSKLKEIEQIKAKNLSLQNMISTLSIKLEKQKAEKNNLNLAEENSIKSFPELKDDKIEDMKSSKMEVTAISQNNSFFFSNINDIEQILGKNGNKKEKKLKRIEKINMLYQQNKKNKIKNNVIKEKNLKNEEDIYNSKVFQKQKLRNSNIKKPKEQNEILKSIKKENEQLKGENIDFEDKILKVQKEIEDMKRIYEDEIKKIQAEEEED